MTPKKEKQSEELIIVKRHWNNQVDEIKKSNGKIKLLIIGEAPISVNQYYYNPIKNYQYLDDLINYYKPAKGMTIQDKHKLLIEKGILLIELYPFPLASKLYDADKHFKFWDPIFFENQIKTLSTNGLIDDNPHLIFRYRKLCQNKSASKNVEKHINDEVLPILKAHGLHNKLLKKGTDYLTLTVGANGRGLTKDIDFLQFLKSL